MDNHKLGLDQQRAQTFEAGGGRIILDVRSGSIPRVNRLELAAVDRNARFAEQLETSA